MELKPVAETKNIKLAGRKVAVPFPVTVERQFKLSVKLFYKHIVQRNELKLKLRIYNAFLEFIFFKSKAYELKENLYKKVVDSRAFAHFR